MKTIAITIDESSLERLDHLMQDEDTPFKSRSEVIRQAVQEFVTRLERLRGEEQERQILRRHCKRLRRQAAALIKEQAKL